MKKTSLLPAVLLVFIPALFSGCFPYSYEVYVAEVMSLDELRSAVRATAPAPVAEAGKIYLWDRYLFLNDVQRGIHVFDVSDSRAPKKKAFIEIPGNIDLAVRDGYLYADSFIDLVVLDVRNMNDIREVDREEGVFPSDPYQILGGTEEWLPIEWPEGIESESYVVTGVRKERRRSWELVIGMGSDTVPTNSAESGGIGGSMSRFTAGDTYLYTVSSCDLKLFDITKPENPEPFAVVPIGWDIETVFPYEDKLFIGSERGMYIYDISEAGNPVKVSELEHVRSYDPVVTDGSYAFVTLRQRFQGDDSRNELLVIDLAIIENPILRSEYAMYGPYGLGVDAGFLFVCDGDAGLKVYTVDSLMDSEPSVELVVWKSDLKTYDVIPYKGTLYLTGPEGVALYDYSVLSPDMQSDEWSELSIISIPEP